MPSSFFELQLKVYADEVTGNINDPVEYSAAEKSIKIPARHVVREPWITPGILDSFRHLDKPYNKKKNKTTG